MLKVIIGAEQDSQEGWVSTQLDTLNVLNLDDWQKNFAKNSIDCLLAEHVWEHMTFEDGIQAAKNCFRYIKPGGYFRCAVPDINFDNDWYQDLVQVGGPGPADHPAADHKIVYDYKQLKSVFEQAGFEVELLEYCDENKVFHYKYWNELDGRIKRSYRFSPRNTEHELGMVSIIIDAKKVLKI